MSAKRISPVLAIRIHPQLRKRIKAAAKLEHQSESQFARKLLESASNQILTGASQP
jgi:predicted HicB family RNase H-like nuclease